MVMFVDEDKMSPIQLALETAKFELASLHGSTVVTELEPNYRRVLDNTQALQRINDALRLIKTHTD